VDSLHPTTPMAQQFQQQLACPRQKNAPASSVLEEALVLTGIENIQTSRATPTYTTEETRECGGRAQLWAHRY